MSTTNQIQIAYGVESPLGTPATQLKLLRLTGEGVTLRNTYIDNDEIRADRQPLGTTHVDAEVVGPINSYLSFLGTDDFNYMAFMSAWALTPEKDNAGTADSAITQVTDSTDTFTVDAGGTAFKLGHLIQTTGFTNAANNGKFRVASSTGTTVVVGGTPTLTDEAAPPGTAKIKVIGFEGASGDITATATGLGSTALDFTTLGLAVGQWVVIGDTGAAYRFGNVDANNGRARITAITATALTLDNRPSGWNTDNGASKTIRVFFGDRLRNGATEYAATIEKGFLAHSPVNYIVFDGVRMGGMTLNVRPGQQATVAYTTMGRTARAATTTPVDASISAAPTGAIMNAVTDVAGLALGGTLVTGPNFIQEFGFDLQNNLLRGSAVGVLGAAVVAPGKLKISGNLTTYFGSVSIWNDIVNNTKTSLYLALKKENQGYILALPAVRLRGDAPAASGSDQWAVINSTYDAEYDATMGFTASLDRFHYLP